jgi:hypothetical protein
MPGPDMSATHDDLQRSLGRVEGSQSQLEARMDRFEKLVSDGFDKLEGSLSAIDQRLAAIEKKETERKGAWKVIVMVAGGVSAVVAAVIKLFIS